VIELAIGLFVFFVVAVFVVRTAVHFRRTGDTGFRGLSGRPLTASWWAGVLFVAALVVGLVALLAGWWGMAPIPVLDSSVVNRTGLVLAVCGVLATLVAQLDMGSAWRVGVDQDERTTLVTTGLFGIVRNPFFSGTGMTAAGLAMMVPNVLAVAGLLALVVALELQVRVVEEPYLRLAHGAAYEAYAARTGRFLPSLRPAAGASRTVYDHHHRESSSP
jgi:protein-S-isoprenylcysteine O-methyltransferase Ste14